MTQSTLRLAWLILLVLPVALRSEVVEWPVTEGAPGGGRFSPLTEIDRSNVHQLEVGWVYRHGDAFVGSWPLRDSKATAMQSTPVVVDGRLIFTTPYNRVIALDPETGRELWTFDPEIDRDRVYANMMINRGVAVWGAQHPDASAGSCSQRVFLGTLAMGLWALDATTGRPCPDFGDEGRVDLLVGLDPVIDSFDAYVTSPPTVVEDVVVAGFGSADTIRRRAPPGDVRAYDVRTGALRWTFRTIPAPGEAGSETWPPSGRSRTGAASVWTTMTADPERDLVFLPVSSASPDWYGGDRPGDNLFSDSLVALRASTGERVWHFQTVHHDLWDYDLPAPPNLVQVEREGVLIDAVAQVTKTGFVFVLERETGQPLFPIEERPVPQSRLPGEASSPTQPFPVKPPPLIPLRIEESDLWKRDARHLARCTELYRSLHYQGIFTPTTLEGSLNYPFSGGGANWSGAGYDPRKRRLFVPINKLAYQTRLRPVGGDPESDLARPSSRALDALWWLITGRGTGLRYRLSPISGRTLFAVDDLPCNAPPWGLLVAVDLDEGRIRWSVPAGEADGVEGLHAYGPVLTTASGLVFHAGSKDLHLRVHDAESGSVLHRIALPAGLHAGPVTYKLGPDRPQWLVVTPGGHPRVPSKIGDFVIAYRLPANPARATQLPMPSRSGGGSPAIMPPSITNSDPVQ